MPRVVETHVFGDYQIYQWLDLYPEHYQPPFALEESISGEAQTQASGIKK
jgi:hypothetical protein